MTAKLHRINCNVSTHSSYLTNQSPKQKEELNPLFCHAVYCRQSKAITRVPEDNDKIAK